MAIIETHKRGNLTVTIHDDYIKSREESEEIMQRVAENMLRQLNAQINANLEKGIPLTEEERKKYHIVKRSDMNL